MNPTPAHGVTASAPARETHAILLVVEDELMTRSALLWMLNTHGYHALLAPSGERALAMIKALGSEFFSVLITDVNLPGMGGIQLAAELRAVRPELKTLFVSGMSKEKFAEIDADLSQAVFVPKPLNADQMIAALRGLLKEQSY